MGGVRVVVDPADEADARRLLAEVQAESESESGTEAGDAPA
jgi:hypothetical protein